MEKKNKVVAIVISIVGVIVITGMIITQVFMKTNVIERVSQSQEVSEVPKALDVSSWDTSKVTVYTDKSGKKAPIPVGYVASQVTGETEIDTGLVIYEGTEPVTGTLEVDSETKLMKIETEEQKAAWTASCERNQWVWVPVDDVSRIYDSSTRMSKLYSITQTGRSDYTNSNYEPGVVRYDKEEIFSKYNLPGMTKKKLLYEIETELVETVKSIEKYGGFYIGRYENGDILTVKPVVKRMNTHICNTYWYDAYVNLRTLGANENVKANIIYGCLWDETLQWFRESGAKTDAELYNSATWGNHKDSEGFTYYTNVSGSTGTKNQGSGKSTPTGATERNKANNIYDMAGNVYELTMEGDKFIYDNRYERGGYYGGNTRYYSVGRRENYYPVSNNLNLRCACVLLYKIEILREEFEQMRLKRQLAK